VRLRNAAAGRLMFGTAAPDAARQQALQQVEVWVRERFRLPPAAVVMVTELACQLPGCPPLETAIVFWTDPDAAPPVRSHLKVFKPVQQVVQEDLPPWWMKDALAALPDWICACC
jgi:nitrate reductase delta subunit